MSATKPRPCDGSNAGGDGESPPLPSRSFGAAREAPVAVDISDMGTIAPAFPLEAVRLAGFEATALGKRYPNVSVAILDGRLVATIAYDTSVLAEETVAALAARTRGVSGGVGG